MEETLTYMVAMLVRLLVSYSPPYCILLDGVSMCLTNDAYLWTNGFRNSILLGGGGLTLIRCPLIFQIDCFGGHK